MLTLEQRVRRGESVRLSGAGGHMKVAYHDGFFWLTDAGWCPLYALCERHEKWNAEWQEAKDGATCPYGDRFTMTKEAKCEEKDSH